MQQEQIYLVVLIVLVIAVAVAIWYTMARRRTGALRERFGDEYDRTLEARGGRKAAEADLQGRQKRVAELDIRPLTPQERERFAGEWHEVKAIFVDSPAEAVLHADRMLANMMQARGYPMADFDRRYEALTVDHGDVARHYRAGHEAVERHNSGSADTEDLRQAMKHYEALYEDLVNDISDTVEHRPVTARASN